MKIEKWKNIFAKGGREYSKQIRNPKSEIEKLTRLKDVVGQVVDCRLNKEQTRSLAILASWREEKEVLTAPRTEGAEDKEPQSTQREIGVIKEENQKEKLNHKIRSI